MLLYNRTAGNTSTYGKFAQSKKCTAQSKNYFELLSNTCLEVIRIVTAMTTILYE